MARLAEEDAKPFVQKLRSVLHHPEPNTVVRATWILGERQEVSALTDLIEALETSQDGFLAEGAAAALGKIANPIALPVLERAAGITNGVTI
jgi:HEAT repeat protein